MISFLSRTIDFFFFFRAYGFICGWPRPVSSRSAKLPGWRSPPIVTIVTIVTIQQNRTRLHFNSVIKLDFFVTIGTEIGLKLAAGVEQRNYLIIFLFPLSLMRVPPLAGIPSTLTSNLTLQHYYITFINYCLCLYPESWSRGRSVLVQKCTFSLPSGCKICTGPHTAPQNAKFPVNINSL